jgi:hypothetical protein
MSQVVQLTATRSAFVPRLVLRVQFIDPALEIQRRLQPRFRRTPAWFCVRGWGLLRRSSPSLLLLPPALLFLAQRLSLGHDRYGAARHVSRHQVLVERASGIRRGEFADQRQVEGGQHGTPGFLSRYRTTSHLERRIELVPTVRQAFEERAVVGVVAVHFVAGENMGNMLPFIACRPQDAVRQTLPGLKYRLGVQGTAERAVDMGES